MSADDIRPDSARGLRDALYADAGSVSVLGDGSLRKLCLNLPPEPTSKPLIKAHVVAEVLLRRWLYTAEARGAFDDVVQSFFPGKLVHACDALPRPRECSSDIVRQEVAFERDSVQAQTWGIFLSRVQAFSDAHGLMPIICSDGSAIAIPFSISGRGEAGCIADETGRIAKGWASEAEGLWRHLGEGCRVHLHCRLPAQDDSSASTTGGSFALPVFLALHRTELPDFPPLAVLSTGAISDGKIQTVKAINEKRELAKKLGVDLFIAPGNEQSDRCLSLRARMPVEEAFREIKAALIARGLIKTPETHARQPSKDEPLLFDFTPYLEDKRRMFTGREWLFEEIDRWPYHDEERTLLIVGEPGLGKSSIVAEFVHGNRGEQVIAHHCCQSDQPETLRPGRFILSIAAMLASNLPDYAMQFESPSVADWLSEKRCEDDPSSAFSQAILVPLRSLPPPVDGARYILVDALDEALGHGGGKSVNIVDVLFGRLELMPSWLRVVATTRNDPAVLSSRLSKPPCIRLDAADSRNTADLDDYIRRRIQETPDLAQKLLKSRVPADQVIALLRERSDGNFLYAVHALNGVQCNHYSFKLLKALPPGLEGLYSQFFERIFGKTRDAAFESRYDGARAFLQVMIAAREPLTASELAIASGVDAEEELPKKLRLLKQLLRSGSRNGEETFAFSHKSFADWLSVKDHEFYIRKIKGARRLADFCASEESNATSPSYYVRRHGIAHFTEVEEWDRAAEWLSDLHFINARAREGEILDLQIDYARVLQGLPEAQEENMREQTRRKDVDRWTREIVNYASAWSSRRERLATGKAVSSAEPPFPKPPQVVPRWSDQEISDEVERISREPTRFDRVRAFRTFVANSALELARFAEISGFVIQHAFNSDLSGLIHDAGERMLPTLSGRVLLQKWEPLERFKSRCDFPRVLSGSGPVCISSDGRRAISSDTQHRNVVVWNLETGESVHELRGHTDRIIAMSMTPDGKRAISASRDKTLRVWNLETGETLKVLNDQSFQVCMTPDGRRAVSTSDGDKLKIWDLERYVCERVFDQWEFHADSICILADGRRLFFCGFHQTWHAWDLENGGLALTVEGHFAQIEGLAVTPDGACAISADTFGKLLVWDLKTGDRLLELRHTSDALNLELDRERFNLVGITPNAERAISTGLDDTLQLWDLKTGQELCVFPGHSGEIDWLSMSADGSRAISASEDSTLRVWDLQKGGAREGKFPIYFRPFNPVFTVVGQRGVSGECDGSIRVWNLEGSQPEKEIGGEEDWESWGGSKGITHVVMTSDQSIAVSRSREGVIQAWDLETEALVKKRERYHGIKNFCVCISPNNQFVIFAECNRLLKWDIHTEKECVLGEHPGVRSVHITQEGRRALSAGIDDMLRIWDLDDERCLLEIPASSVRSLDTKADGRLAMFISSDVPDPVEYVLSVLDLESGQTLWRLPGAKEAIATPDGRRLIVAGHDDTLRVYDLEAGSPVGESLQHSGKVCSLRISADGRLVVFGTEDRTFRVWDWEHGEIDIVMVTPSVVRSIFVGYRTEHWVALTDSGLLFFDSRSVSPMGPLITTASRVIYSEDAAPGPAFARPLCCGLEFEVPPNAAQRIDATGLQPSSAAFTDPVLLLNCPHCQTRLRLNPFFLEVLPPT